MEGSQQCQNMLENILLRRGIVSVTGAKDVVGCDVISFQTQQQLLFTQVDHSRLTELLHIVVTYCNSALVSFLVNMSHCTPLFIDKFIDVIGKLERKMSERKIKRVYVIRPERKPIRKHLFKELGSNNNNNNNNNENAGINAEIIVVKSFEELYQYIKQRDLTFEFGGTLQYDHNAWLAVQKTLVHFYLLVNNLATASPDVVNRIRDLTSEGVGTKATERLTENAQRKRLRKAEKNKNEIFRQCNITNVLQNGQRLLSYFENPMLQENFQTLSKSPVFQQDKAVFQQYYRKLLALQDGFEHAWKEAVGKMRSFATEQELYNRLIECCTWIVEEGLPYLTPVPTQSKTLAEAVKQKNNFQNEFYKPAKMILRKSRHSLKEVRQYQRSLPTRNGSLDLMADNLTQLMENLKTKSDLRLKHFTSEKDFIHAFAKAESWYEKASDLCSAIALPTSTPGNIRPLQTKCIDPKIENFLKNHPPMTREEFGHLLDYAEEIDDLDLRNRARLLGNRCQEFERMLRARETHHGDFSDEERRSIYSSDLESSSDLKRPPCCQNSSLQCCTHRADKKSTFFKKSTTDFSTKRWHDEVTSSTTASNDDVVNSESGSEDFRTGVDNSRLADIQKRLRDQELLYEQLILEQEIRELAEGKSSPDKADAFLSSNFNESHTTEDFDRENNSRTAFRNEDAKFDFSSSFNNSKIEKSNRILNAGIAKTAWDEEYCPASMPFTSSLNRSTEIGSLGAAVNDCHPGKAVKNGRSKTQQRKSRKGKHRSIASDLNSIRSAVIENMDQNGNDPAIGRINKTVNIGANGTNREFGLLPVDTHSSDFPTSADKESRGSLTRKEENQREMNLPSPVDLLDGCNSLRRLCNLEIPSPQDNTTSKFEKYYSPGRSTSTNSSSGLIFPDGNVTNSTDETRLEFEDTAPEMSSESRNRSQDPKDYASGSENSRDMEFYSHEVEVRAHDSGSRSGNHEIEEVKNPTNDAVDMRIVQDFENSSHCALPNPGNSLRAIECYSRDSKTSSRKVENSSDNSNDSSREELLKTASEAVNHWTKIKNEQRARLTQIVDDISTRKEIEEAYFNAQIQLCRARQSIATLNTTDSGQAELSLKQFVNGQMASSFNTSLKCPNLEDKSFDGNGAFRKYIRGSGNNKQNTNLQEKGNDILLGTEGEQGRIGVKSNDVGRDASGPFGSKQFPVIPNEKAGTLQDDRVLQENCNEFDPELESSDEFDDDVEEEELMLLCSQSSSGLLTQDELKESLHEEQARLEDKFRQQREQLRLEREKLIEGDKNIFKQENKNLDLKEEVGIDEERRSIKRSKESQELLHDVESIRCDPLDKIDESEKSNLHDEIMPVEPDIPQPKPDRFGSQQDVCEPVRDIFGPEHVEARETREMPSFPYEATSPRHEIPSTHSEIPSQKHKTLSEQNEISSPQLDTLPLQHEIPSSNHVAASSQPEIPSLQDEITADNGELVSQNEPYRLQDDLNSFRSLSQRETEIPGLKLFNQENTPSTRIKPIDPTEKNISDDVRADGGVSNISEIIVSNLDSDDNSRCKIEEELISILQQRPSQVQREISEVASPKFPPLGIDNYPPAIFEHNDDDIDAMNQLIDDLMISDLNTDNQCDYDEADLDDLRGNETEHTVNIDNGEDDVISRVVNESELLADLDSVGVNFGDDEGDIMLDIDSGGRFVDDEKVSGEDVDLSLDDVGRDLHGDEEVDDGDVEINVDSGKVNVDFGGVRQQRIDLPHFGSNNSEYNSDNHSKDNDNRESKMRNYLIDLNNVNDIETKWDNHEISYDSLKENRHKSISDHSQTGSHRGRTGSPYDDRMSAEGKGSRDESVGIDIDFTVDLSKHSEAVLANDLIGLLHNHDEAFSSQESLEVEEEPDVEKNSDGICNTEGSHKIIDMDNSKEEGILEEEASLDKHNSEAEETSNISEEHPSSDDQNVIPEGHQFMSEDSEDDDDFGRVLEDIKEEESEYENLMRYKATHVDCNDNQVQEQSNIIVPSSSVLRTARCDDDNTNSEDSAVNSSSSYTSSIIIDPGTGYCKAGFSVDDQPRVLIPSVVGKPKSEVQHSGRYNDYYVGEEAKHLHRVLNLHRPFKNGLVEDWDLMEKLLDEVYEELRCESDQYPVLLSEPVSNPKSSREEMIQVMFETFHVPAAYSCAQAVLSLFATGRTTGLVYDCGYSQAHSVPVYDGYALSHATITTELAGRELTACLSRMLRDRHVTMETFAELDVARDIKEKLCYVVMDYDNERKAYNVGERNDTFYTMPDGQTIAIGSERFRCPEVLFAPSIIGMATDGVQEVIYKTTMQCAVDVRSSLLQNIVISGGSTMFPGFSRRLHVELCKLLGSRTPDSIKIDAVDNRNLLTWQGGAMLSKLSNFKSMWITSHEYEEFGPGIVHKKCV